MKTRSMLIGVAMAAVLNCAAVNAQGLGGIGGGLGGGLSGGLRDMSMTSQGALNGSLGADLDTGSLRRSTRDTTDRVANRARKTTDTVRDRATTKVDQTRAKVGETREMATASTSSAAAAAAGAVKGVQIEGAADMAGTATSNVSRDGVNLAGAAQGAGGGAVKGAAVPQPSESSNASHGLLDAPKTTDTQSGRGLNIAGDANGSASASPSGGSAEGGGKMSASRK